MNEVETESRPLPIFFSEVLHISLFVVLYLFIVLENFMNVRFEIYSVHMIFQLLDCFLWVHILENIVARQLPPKKTIDYGIKLVILLGTRYL